MLTLYRRIRNLRVGLGLSQEELAQKVGYTSRTSIAKIEAGQVDLPQSKIIALAEALETTPAQLMGWDNSNGAKPSFPSQRAEGGEAAIYLHLLQGAQRLELDQRDVDLLLDIAQQLKAKDRALEQAQTEAAVQDQEKNKKDSIQ